MSGEPDYERPCNYFNELGSYPSNGDGGSGGTL